MHHRPAVSSCEGNPRLADPFAVELVEMEIDESLLVDFRLRETYDAEAANYGSKRIESIASCLADTASAPKTLRYLLLWNFSFFNRITKH